MSDVLGILLVTSTSRGRNVFRYPPDPSSPSTRLSQPIYSHSTYTTQHINTVTRSARLFPAEWDGRKPSSSSLPSSHRRSKSSRLLAGPRQSGSSDGGSLHPRSDGSRSQKERPSVNAAGMPISRARLEDPDSSDSGYEYDSEDDFEPVEPFSGRRVEEEVIKAQSKTLDVLKGTGEKEKDKSTDPSIEQQYSLALGYTLDALSDMLTPPRSACNRKFELCANELVFIGHPVSISSNGQWRFPEEEPRGTRETRGRQGRYERHERYDGERQEKDDRLRTVVESEDSDTNTNTDTDKYPTLNMFHVVVLVDKPDPQVPSLGTQGVTPTDKYDEIYREIAFKWTAAAYDLQVRENFIARESWEMARMREQFMNEGLSIVQCAAYMYHHNPLERALQDLALALHKYRHTPINPLYAHLSTTLCVSLAGTSISMTLSPRYEPVAEAWSLWDSVAKDDASSVSSDGTDDDVTIEPWHTLLLVDGTRLLAREVAGAIVGRDAQVTDSRRGSQVEEDEVNLMTALILACDVTKRLDEIAHILRYDLEGIAIPLAKLLVRNKYAIPIHVVNHRLRTLVMPTTTRADKFEDDSSRFAREFPNLSPLAYFLAQLTTSVTPFRDVVPSDVGTDATSRQPYLDALIWLLQNDLVTQVHTRVRIFARPKVKEIAWRQLWQRRRERWLASRAASVVSGDDVTPRADTTFYQSYMDYDPELELDSDVEVVEHEEMDFSTTEPSKDDMPRFETTFIFDPARAVKDEMRWLRVIREVADEVWASKFDLCVQYFDGVATFEEIAYKTQLRMREIDWIVRLFKDDVVVLLHP